MKTLKPLIPLAFGIALALYLVSSVMGKTHSTQPIGTEPTLSGPSAVPAKAKKSQPPANPSRDPSNSLDNTGGPDGGGYRYIDNQTADSATYDWIELRGDNQATWLDFVNSDDDDYLSQSLGNNFNFPFYGASYSSVNVSTNGVLEFALTVTDYNNNCLPSSTFHGAVIFPYWDDLNMDYGGNGFNSDSTIAFRNFGNYCVFEFDSIGHCCDDGTSLKFEVILFSNGWIKMQYNNLVFGDYDSTQTIGIQQSDAGPALQYVCSATGHQPVNHLAIWFYRPFANDFACSAVTTPLPSQVTPNQSINVVAQFANVGTSSGTSPVKYSLDNGSPVSEATGTLSPGQIETHAFGTPLVIPNSPGRHLLKVWADMASDEDRFNDTLSVFLDIGCIVDAAITAPGSWSGNTCNQVDDCNHRNSQSPDVIYAVTIPQNNYRWRFSTCDAATDFDTYLYLTTTCCGDSIIAYDDDDCDLSGHSASSTINYTLLPAGTYYLMVEGYDHTECGNYTLTIDNIPACTNCQSNDFVELAENPADTSFYHTDPNGGCNSVPQRFESINFNQTVCGLGFNYLQLGTPRRDTDWYTFAVTQAESITVHYGGDLPIQIAVLTYADCANQQFLLNTSTNNTCLDEYSVVYAPAGNYALFIAPFSFQNGGTISDSLHYRATLYHGVASADEPPAVVDNFALYQNYPNPFNPETQIRFALPRAADVKLSVFDVTGRLVKVLEDARYEPGTYNVRFDGSHLASGLYFVRMQAADQTQMIKAMLLK